MRIMKNVNISLAEEKQRIDEVIEKVLHNLTLRVLVDGGVEADSEVARWLDGLRARKNMHFAVPKAEPPVQAETEEKAAA